MKRNNFTALLALLLLAQLTMLPAQEQPALTDTLQAAPAVDSLLIPEPQPLEIESGPDAGTVVSTSDNPLADMIKIEGRDIDWPLPGSSAGSSAEKRRSVGFHIDRTEVTNSRFAAFLSAAPAHARHYDPRMQILTSDNIHFSPVAGKEHYPVAFVDWLGAYSFAEWNHKSLPTEDEWMVAALGGRAFASAAIYPWGSDVPDTIRANILAPGRVPALHEVGGHVAGNTTSGIEDLAGNVAEWTLTTEGASADSLGAWIVTKGGSCVDAAPSLDLRRRALRHRDERLMSVGFRCVVRDKNP